MKNVKKIVVALVLFVATTGFVNAQSKVAHINVQQLLSEMPEMLAAQAEIKKLQETYKADLCLLYTSPSPRDQRGSRMPSSA